MIDIQTIVIVLAICTPLTVVAYKKNILNKRGCISAFFLGVIIGLASLYWLGILLFFFVISAIATRYKYSYKEEIMVAEGIKGARDIDSVLANGLVPMGIAIIYIFDNNYKQFILIENDFYWILFISSVSVACSDTLASEIGVLSDKTYLITNFKPIKVGTDGGISALGEFASFFGALIIAFCGFSAYYYYNEISIKFLFIPLIVGFIGCQIDSYLGAIFERRGKLTKGDVNLISIFLGTTIAFLILMLC